MTSIKPYQIAVPQEKLERLKQKLALTDFPDELDDSGWDYGSPLAEVKKLATYWQTDFDWSKAQKKLNELPQFTVPVFVEGFCTLDVHFVHQQSAVKGAIPLLFCHGWPGSFDEVAKILPMLVEGGADHPAFHVVAPSLPNFGFSEGTKKRGFRIKQHAEVCHKLMLALGYTEYATQGGDIGYSVTRHMGLLYPTSCRASHTNFPRPNRPKHLEGAFAWVEYKSKFNARQQADQERTEWFAEKGRAYNELQSTKPQTLGYSLTDSPVGLLAWIYEKMHDWTDHYAWTADEILTWVSIYWFSTAGPAAAQRIYYESHNDPDQMRGKINDYIPDVKLGISRFPKELIISPKEWQKTLGPVVLEREYDHGGHFAAWERPDALVDDLRMMFGRHGGAFGAVSGRNGFED